MPDGRTNFSLKRSASHLLHRAQQYAAEQYSAAGKDLSADSLTMRQFALLAAIDERKADPPTQTDLVQATGIDRSTLAEMITRMEGKDLVRRSKTQSDARANTISLTAAGEAQFRAAIPAAIEADREILGALPKNRRDAFLDLLARIQEVADAEEARPLARPAPPRPPIPIALPGTFPVARASTADSSADKGSGKKRKKKDGKAKKKLKKR